MINTIQEIKCPPLHSNNSNSNDVAKVLEKLSSYWFKNAIVNKPREDYELITFNPEKKDFSESLLPFVFHEAWADAPEEIKDKCLSYAWILYNMKTVYIECDIVTPACEDLIKHSPASLNTIQIQDVISEAMLDEALHTRMSIVACNYIYQRRELTRLESHDFNLVRWLERSLSSYSSEHERQLFRFGVACASETLITDYLRVLVEDPSIQDICHEVTRAHAIDEWNHSSVFSLVATDIIKLLSPTQRKQLHKIITDTVQVFADNELKAWEQVFKTVNFPNYKDILADADSIDNIYIYEDSVHNLLNRINLTKEV